MSHGSVEDGVANQLASYGVPTTLEDYCMQVGPHTIVSPLCGGYLMHTTAKYSFFQAQMASYVQYRALGEGISAKMWRKHTGFLVWKTQSPVPSLRGQLYDYYLQPTAALYGFKKVG